MRLNRNSAVSNPRRLLKGVQSVVSFFSAMMGASDPPFNGFPLLLHATPTIIHSKVVNNAIGIHTIDEWMKLGGVRPLIP